MGTLKPDTCRQGGSFIFKVCMALSRDSHRRLLQWQVSQQL